MSPTRGVIPLDKGVIQPTMCSGSKATKSICETAAAAAMYNDAYKNTYQGTSYRQNETDATAGSYLTATERVPTRTKRQSRTQVPFAKIERRKLVRFRSTLHLQVKTSHSLSIALAPGALFVRAKHYSLQDVSVGAVVLSSAWQVGTSFRSLSALIFTFFRLLFRGYRWTPTMLS